MIMKYRLKKDLPFAKAGTEIVLHVSNLGYPHLTVERQADGYLHIWCRTWQTYDAWIEEVKPREFEIQLCNGEAVNFTTPPPRTFIDKLEYIKVREVMD